MLMAVNMKNGELFLGQRAEIKLTFIAAYYFE
jgi:hypothetical protein